MHGNTWEASMGVLKITDDELFPRINNVFRARGFEGTTIALLSEETGLGKASLYHRFPGGKVEIVEALLRYVENQCMPSMLAPLRAGGPPRARVREVAALIDGFYEGGTCWCLFDTISLGALDLEFQPTVQRLFLAWVEAFAQVAMEAGREERDARHSAEDALVRIQGTLVYSRASGDQGPFQRTLASLDRLLCGDVAAQPAPDMA
jgi:TetR/AcrR family transcriptional regulator, lmrAB and yxaGH operons repressor